MVVQLKSSTPEPGQWKSDDSCNSGPEIRSPKMNGLNPQMLPFIFGLRISGPELQESSDFRFPQTSRESLSSYLFIEYGDLLAA
jgi:hypothetical protein